MAGLRANGHPKEPMRDFQVAYPEAADLVVDLGQVSYLRSRLDPLERFVISALAMVKRPKRIFEIGTFDSATTLLLARAAPEAEILTLDLDSTLAARATIAEEVRNATVGVGASLRGRAEADRITQLSGDSRTFDFRPWRAEVDLVIVDTGHKYETVRTDTAAAQQLLARGGTVIWEDYTAGWPGVVNAVEESGLGIIRITRTHLEVHDSSVARYPP